MIYCIDCVYNIKCIYIYMVYVYVYIYVYIYTCIYIYTYIYMYIQYISLYHYISLARLCLGIQYSNCLDLTSHLHTWSSNHRHLELVGIVLDQRPSHRVEHQGRLQEALAGSSYVLCKPLTSEIMPPFLSQLSTRPTVPVSVSSWRTNHNFLFHRTRGIENV